MNPIDQMIEVLQRVKNCDKALNNLKMADENLIFKENENFTENQKRYLNHVHSLIKDAIKLIEKND